MVAAAGGGSRSLRCQRGRYTACDGSVTAPAHCDGSDVSGAYLDEPTYLHTVGGLNTYDQSCGVREVCYSELLSIYIKLGAAFNRILNVM